MNVFGMVYFKIKTGFEAHVGIFVHVMLMHLFVMLILHVDYGDPYKEIIVYSVIMDDSVIVQLFAY